MESNQSKHSLCLCIACLTVWCLLLQYVWHTQLPQMEKAVLLHPWVCVKSLPLYTVRTDSNLPSLYPLFSRSCWRTLYTLGWDTRGFEARPMMTCWRSLWRQFRTGTVELFSHYLAELSPRCTGLVWLHIHHRQWNQAGKDCMQKYLSQHSMVPVHPIVKMRYCIWLLPKNHTSTLLPCTLFYLRFKTVTLKGFMH